ncbi:hypothetical protein GUJ93_ZPchr0006g45712 [Zizania palustris]|uniref:Uncharacterized protein n=1 Tax=Zizania palustris TaxID=103762 RepID=A0A8J5VXG6_ZIZPA|nr:hypothetical protein GUJ93_ZPchr0006g45712 [Zizania palustris]
MASRVPPSERGDNGYYTASPSCTPCVSTASGHSGRSSRGSTAATPTPVACVVASELMSFAVGVAVFMLWVHQRVRPRRMRVPAQRLPTYHLNNNTYTSHATCTMLNSSVKTQHTHKGARSHKARILLAASSSACTLESPVGMAPCRDIRRIEFMATCNKHTYYLLA